MQFTAVEFETGESFPSQFYLDNSYTPLHIDLRASGVYRDKEVL